MPIIPPRLTSSQRAARLNFLKNIKQKRFWYKDVSSAIKVPSLDPAAIPLILAQQEDYWFDHEWKRRDEERRDQAVAAYMQPPNGYPQNLTDYGNVKAPYPEASGLRHVPRFANDKSFAAQRLCGANPLMIRRVVDLDDWKEKLAVTDVHMPPDVKLEALVRERRLYICDYNDLTSFAGAGGTVWNLGWPLTKYLSAPIALFYWKGGFGDTGELLPLAIQLEQFKSAEVFTPLPPTHPHNWLLAKAAVQVADTQAHEWDSHLIRTHFMLAPFAVSSERHLHDEHPVLVLLRPHLRYLLAINSKTGELVNEGEYGDQLLAPTFENKIKLLMHYYLNLDFSRMANLRTEIAARAMDQASAPIPYPYRDDGGPVYAAIHEYVTAYLKVYYNDAENEVAEDGELQNFIKELRDGNGGRISTLTPNGGPLETIRQLAELLTNVIWTSGPQHAAVNFAQWGYMADPRNMPFAGYGTAPEAANGAPPYPPVNFLPQYAQAKIQAAVMYTLGTWRMDMLGFYRPKDFLDPAALKVIADFQCALARVGAETFARDALRAFDYPYLVPWNIPNSTNI
ncbi:MAG: lipoxygenase family protein [Alphaproteobacteria bacterium]